MTHKILTHACFNPRRKAGCNLTATKKASTE